MSLAINHNLMASNIARSLNQHYSRLYQSTQRLSSGLRINGAADDAAGLAIRELQRADIAALHQGARNVNDAISMIQTFDGALSVIDEKLIRMKELAEQAATGTYNSTQRLMIDSEFISMASEINRIAVATDFNGVKLLCNDISNKLLREPFTNNMRYLNTTEGSINKIAKIERHTEIINASAINSPIQGLQIKQNNYINLKSFTGDGNIAFWRDSNSNVPYDEYILEFSTITGWKLLSHTGNGEPFEYYNVDVDSDNQLQLSGLDNLGNFNGFTIDLDIGQVDYFNDAGEYVINRSAQHLSKDTKFSVILRDPNYNDSYSILNNEDYPNAKIINHGQDKFGPINPFSQLPINSRVFFEIDLDGDNKADIIQTFTGEGTLTPTVQNNYLTIFQFDLNIDFTTKIHFGTGNDSAEDYYYIDTRDCTLKGLGIDDLRIETQEKAQKALVRINDAIERKDNARAYFGAMQNRLENTVTNLQTQAENLQAAESRISDTDVAIEMTNFVRNQILTQSATAMLSQANSLPQMAMQIIGG